MTAVFDVMIDKLLTAQWEVHNGRHHGRPFAGVAINAVPRLENFGSAYIGGGGKILMGLPREHKEKLPGLLRDFLEFRACLGGRTV